MPQGSIRGRLEEAVARSGVADTEQVLTFDDERMPLCGAIRLADSCGLDISDLLGQALTRATDNL